MPVRFIAFSLIGSLGVLVHLAVLGLLFRALEADFVASQLSATLMAMVFNFALNNRITYRDRQLHGLRWVRGLASFMAACSVGALANVGMAAWLYQHEQGWLLAALAGILVGAVWNYAITAVYTWGRARP